jgi:diadenosine hexaphosphate hydrolase (ATP-forming)
MAVPKFDRFKKYFSKKNQIQEIVREPTSGGIIFRRDKEGGVEILLFQDVRDRWSIPKGHIEEGETAEETMVREIEEETALSNIEVFGWLGKVSFRFRRVDRLVLMTTQIYLVRALGDTDAFKKEEWMKDMKWFKFNDALEAIEYDDIGKLMLLAMKRIRQEKL